MYRLFDGRARILGVKEGKLNCKGFEGSHQSLERGHPGFMPDAPRARDLPLESWESELKEAIAPYGIDPAELPTELLEAIRSRKSFTLVEGEEPRLLYKGRVDSEDLVTKLLRHDQATAAIEQLRVYAFHNRHIMNGGRPLELEAIEPYPGFEHPRVFEIPALLKDEDGVQQSTTANGTQPAGRLILFTSRENMPSAYKKLKPRWKITYRANQNHVIGSKPISDLVPGVTGSYFVFGTVELLALEPDYVSLGRLRPNDGPLVSALDRFIGERIRDLAKEINERRRQELDDKTLDEVQRENRMLDRFKNQFLTSLETGVGAGDGDGEGEGGNRPIHEHSPPESGITPESVDLAWDPTRSLRLGRGIVVHFSAILGPRVLDATGRTVPTAELEWLTADRHVVEFVGEDRMRVVEKGKTTVWCRVRDSAVESARIEVDVWAVDHVLLTPRVLEIPLGKREQITAQVTNDEGARATDVLLNWSHDAADPLVVRISPWGYVTGNRLGKTSVSAGVGDETAGGVWARIRAEVTVIPNPREQDRGGGFPKLLVTDRDVDPSTGEVRESNVDMPTLWQEVSDYQRNIWWLNLGSPEAAFFFAQRTESPNHWRAFHSQKLIEVHPTKAYLVS